MLIPIYTHSGKAFAQAEYPSRGILYNTVESNWLTYTCSPPDNGKLTCEFSQTSVRIKAKAEDIQKKLEQAKEQFSSALEEIEDGESCKFFDLIADALSGKKTLEEIVKDAPKGMISNKEEFVKGFGEISDDRKRELLEKFSTMQEFCRNKDESSYLAITKKEHEIDAKTCTIQGGYSFSQTFTYIDDYEGQGVWAVESTPSGPCGTIQLSRFIPQKTNIAGKEYINWTYLAQKAVTNKSGTFFMDIKCSDLDQGEYFYDWSSGTSESKGLYKKNCTNIEFSPL